MARKHVRAFIGMSAAQAVEVIEHCWERHQTDKAKPPPERQVDWLELGHLATAAHYRYSFDRMFCDIRAFARKTKNKVVSSYLGKSFQTSI